MNQTGLKTTCAYCGVGCGVTVPTENDRRVNVSGDAQHPANRGRLCVKGTHLGDVLPLKDRLLIPSVHGEPVSWDLASQTIADKIRQAQAQYGANSVAFYLSGQLLTEDYYAANKLAKGFLGTANVDTNSRLCMASAVAAHVRAFGEDAPPSCYEDVEIADLVVVTGSNLAWAHPVLFQRLQAARAEQPSKKMVVIDPRKTATALEADLHLAIKPGADGQLFNALLVYLDKHQACAREYIAEHVSGYAQTLAAATLDVGTDSRIQAELCGLPEADLLAFFALFAQTPKTTTLWSMGINQSESGVDKSNAIINVHLATGRIGQPGASAFSITGQPNAMGGREVGGLANQLAIHRGFDADSIAQVGAFWQASHMAQKPGLKAVDLFDACLAGDIKVLWIMATNPVASLPDANKIRAALAQVETLIVSEVVQSTDTLDCADIRLPALAWGEKDGTVTNSERTISRQRPFLIAPGQARADWWALATVAQKLGFTDAFAWHHAHEIFREHARLSRLNRATALSFDLSAVADLSLAEYQDWLPQQWPLDGTTRTPRLFGDGQFPSHDGRAQMVPISPISVDQPDGGDYILNTGRLRDQWHTMARTGYAMALNQHSPQFELHIHPNDAEHNAIVNGDLVAVRSDLGSFYALARIDAAQQPSELFAAMHWNRQFASHGGVANVIASRVDPISGQPASKHARVQLAKQTSQANGFLFIGDGQPAPDWLNELLWFKTHTRQGTLYRFFSLQQSLADFIALRSQDGTPCTMSLTDSSQQSAQWIGQDAGGLQFWLSIHRAATPWPDSLFLDRAAEQPNPGLSLNALLTGQQDDAPIRGKMVCTCFSVTDSQITDFLQSHAQASLSTLQTALCCGTNCGSCLTEVKTLMKDKASARTASADALC